MKADFRQFTRFVAVSLVAAALNIGSRIGFSLLVPYTVAIVLAFMVGLSTAFVLNRMLVFVDHDNAFHQQAFWFTAVNVAALAQTLAISLLLVKWLFPILGMNWHAPTIAHVIGVGVPAITSYLGHRYLSFRPARPHP